ncbi:MAG: secreted alkaline phosphatase [Labilithrix sp.]|nr:secreted alkaline phosphatase [Labilithrix sp.]
MEVEWSTSPRFERVVRIDGPTVGAHTDLIGKVALTGLPGGAKVHYRARFDDSPWVTGSFGTPAADSRDVVLAWSGDTNGQGWGIDPARGGMPTYSALLARAPDLFVHCGDTIYADGPIPPTIALDDGGTWNNLVDSAKDHVAQTLDDFRGAHRYPRHSKEVRALSAAVPLFSIWDDHEIRNNWFPGEVLDDARYQERRVTELAVHARRAMYEYAPTLRSMARMYRSIPWGPLLEVFVLDGRTYRTPNEPAPAEGALLGAEQAAWLLDALSRSRAVWKVVASNMPLSLVVSEPRKTIAQAFDGWANEDGPPRERELELARLLSAVRARAVKNVVWLTADVHYAAAHRMDPARAAFKDFDPFWELVAGPMHATAFPRRPLDDTFGPEVAWSSADWGTFGSPATGAQHFGLLRIDGRTHELGVSFVDARGRDLHRFTIRAS